MAIEVDFTVVLRGYDRAEVDRLLRQVDEALASGDPRLRAAATDAVREAEFRFALRGYDRSQVDDLIRRLPAVLA